MVAVPGGAEALAALSGRIVRDHETLTFGVYSTRKEFIKTMTAATQRAGEALSINLASGVSFNQSVGFSDRYGTGANPAANASYRLGLRRQPLPRDPAAAPRVEALMPCDRMDGLNPVVDPAAYVHPSAVLIGDVNVGPRF